MVFCQVFYEMFTSTFDQIWYVISMSQLTKANGKKKGMNKDFKAHGCLKVNSRTG